MHYLINQNFRLIHTKKQKTSSKQLRNTAQPQQDRKFVFVTHTRQKYSELSTPGEKALSSESPPNPPYFFREYFPRNRSESIIVHDTASDDAIDRFLGEKSPRRPYVCRGPKVLRAFSQTGVRLMWSRRVCVSLNYVTLSVMCYYDMIRHGWALVACFRWFWWFWALEVVSDECRVCRMCHVARIWLDSAKDGLGI